MAGKIGYAGLMSTHCICICKECAVAITGIIM